MFRQQGDGVVNLGVEAVLGEHEEDLYQIMQQHFVKHLSPFGAPV